MTLVGLSAVLLALFTYSVSILTEILKKQAAQNAQEYDRLATEYNEATGQTSNKKSD